MSSPSKGKNTCFACNEDLLETGGYHLKILPPKRIPTKIQRMLRKRIMTGVEDATYRKYKEGRFQKYFKDMKPSSLTSNMMEVSCGVCKSVSKICMRKTQKQPALDSSRLATPASSKSLSTTPLTLTKSQKKRQRRSKTPKDLNAGLIIPESMKTSSEEPKPKKARLQNERTGTPATSHDFEATQANDARTSKPKQKSSDAMAEAQKQKQVNALRKTLFKAKQKFDNSDASKSLYDFLS